MWSFSYNMLKVHEVYPCRVVLSVQLTIPKDAGSSIDQNALSVKLMAVDHQTSSE